MAIEITRFTKPDNFTQLAQWLTNNAVPDYFDSVTLSNNAVTCAIGENAYYKIAWGQGVIYAIKGDGMTDECSFSGPYLPGQFYFDYAVKTSNGIMLHTTNNSCEIVITKTENGGVAFVFSSNAVFGTFVSGGTTHYPGIMMISVENSSEAIRFPTTSEQDHGQISAAKTVLAPVVIGVTGDICPNCFFLPFNQYLGTECQFVLDNVNYYSNGYVALKE